MRRQKALGIVEAFQEHIPGDDRIWSGVG